MSVAAAHSIDLRSEIGRQLASLAPLANKAVVHSAYWIVTPDGEYVGNNGNEWCKSCGLAKVKHLKKHDRKHRDDYLLDGGWPSEHDTPPHCAHCGIPLEASLTEYGALYELENFSEFSPEPGNAVHANELYQMLSALEYVDDDMVWAAAEAIAIVDKFLAAKGGAL